MTKLLIEKKYNRQLNIFLGIYITLCLIFALLFNGFFVKPKAFTNGTNYTISYNLVAYDDAVCTTDVRYNWSGESRYIFYSDPDFKDVLESVISGNLNKNVTCSCIRISKTNQDSIIGGSVSSSVVSQLGPYSAAAQQNYAISFDNSTIYNYFRDKGFALDPVAGYPYWVNFVVNGSNINSNKVIGGKLLSDDVQYIDTPENLYKYMVQNDDSVVNIGNPDEIPQSPEDNALPVPQQLKFIEGSNKDYATSIDRYLVSVGWNNPQSASFDAYTNIRAEIKYKVKMKAQSGTLFLNKGTYTTDYVDSTFKLSNSAISNHYVTKYDSVGYAQPNENIPEANKNPKYMSGITNYIYQDSLLNNAMLQVIQANDLKYFPLYTYNIIEGTQLSMRYIGSLNGKDYSSLWVTVNYSGSMVSKDKITFENASGEPVNPDDVDYNNSSDTYTNNDDTWSITGFFQNLSASISSVFTSVSEFFSSGDNGNSSFYKFFSKVFTEFPGFFAMFFIGLGIAIILRIIGR